jgi:uracil-DNA glycosylase
MRPDRLIRCDTFPCGDVRHDRFEVPGVSIDAEAISVIMVSEVPPQDPSDGYYAHGDPLFARTTLQAFRDAGRDVHHLRDVVALGVYLTTAVKCAKEAPGVCAPTIASCSVLLERELGLFPNACALLLMGDVAIKAVNAIARRSGEPRVIPAGSTYKIRGGDLRFRGMRVFPSYLQAGPAYFIETSKRRMIAEDIDAALRFAGV